MRRDPTDIIAVECTGCFTPVFRAEKRHYGYAPRTLALLIEQAKRDHMRDCGAIPL